MSVGFCGAAGYSLGAAPVWISCRRRGAVRLEMRTRRSKPLANVTRIEESLRLLDFMGTQPTWWRSCELTAITKCDSHKLDLDRIRRLCSPMAVVQRGDASYCRVTPAKNGLAVPPPSPSCIANSRRQPVERIAESISFRAAPDVNPACRS